MKLILDGVIETISTRVDGSLKFVTGTQEIDPTNAATLLQLRGKYVKVLLSDTNISPMEEQIVDTTELKDGRKIKSKAQRLRSVIYREWEKSGLNIDFESFYDTEMEKHIDGHKENIRELERDAEA